MHLKKTNEFSRSKKPMSDAKNDFMNLVTCMCMFGSHYDAAVQVEYVLKTDGTLMKTFFKHRFGKFNRDVFLEKHFNDALMFTLFYPRANPLFMEHMMGIYRENESLLLFLAEQYHAQQVWDAFFVFAEDFHIITRKSVQQLADRVHAEHLKPVLKACAERNKFNQHFFIDHQAPKLTTKLASAFLNVLPKNIIIDDVAGDGNCFFQSITNQFVELIDNKLITPNALRMYIHEYCKTHFDELLAAVEVWQKMFKLEKRSPEWAFFRVYAHIANAREIARNMIRDKMFLSKDFYAEAFTMGLIVEYLNGVLKRNLMIILIDTVNEPSPVLGHTELGKENIYTMLLKEPLHYTSIGIKHIGRVFTRRTLPKLKFTFLAHLEPVD